MRHLTSIAQVADQSPALQERPRFDWESDELVSNSEPAKKPDSSAKNTDSLAKKPDSSTKNTDSFNRPIPDLADLNGPDESVQTALKVPLRTNVTVKKPMVIDRTKPIVGLGGRTYFPNQLNKSNSLLVLAYEPDIRAEYVVSTARHLLDAEQQVRAKALALTYDQQFQDLARERATILEFAFDGNNIDEQVLTTQMKLADLLRQIRSRVTNEIMTPEQYAELIRQMQDYQK